MANSFSSEVSELADILKDRNFFSFFLSTDDLFKSNSAGKKERSGNHLQKKLEAFMYFEQNNQNLICSDHSHNYTA